MPLRKALDIYVNDHHELAAETVRSYRGTIERNLSDWLDRAAYIDYGRALPARHGEIAKRSRAEAGKTDKVLCAIWNHARLKDRATFLRDLNPTLILGEVGVRVRLAPRKERLQADEIGPWLRALSSIDPAEALRFRVLLTLGLRISEGIALDLSRVDLKRATLAILGKGSKERTAYLPRRLVKLLQQASTTGWAVSGERDLRRLLVQVNAAAGIERNVRPHDLRRSFASVLASLGCPDSAIAQPARACA